MKLEIEKMKINFYSGEDSIMDLNFDVSIDKMSFITKPDEVKDLIKSLADVTIDSIAKCISSSTDNTFHEQAIDIPNVFNKK